MKTKTFTDSIINDFADLRAECTFVLENEPRLSAGAFFPRAYLKADGEVELCKEYEGTYYSADDMSRNGWAEDVTAELNEASEDKFQDAVAALRSEAFDSQ